LISLTEKKDIHNTSTHHVGMNIDMFAEEACDIRGIGKMGLRHVL